MDEQKRSKIFRYLFECEKATKSLNLWNQVKNLTKDFDLSKNDAENHIIEYCTQYEKVITQYVPEKLRLSYHDMHYKTFTNILDNFYKTVPPF